MKFEGAEDFVPGAMDTPVQSPDYEFYKGYTGKGIVKEATGGSWKETFQFKGDEPYDAGFKSLFQTDEAGKWDPKLTGRMQEAFAPWKGKTLADVYGEVKEGDYEGLGMYGQAAQWGIPGMQTTDIAVAQPKNIALALSPFGNPNWAQGLPRP